MAKWSDCPGLPLNWSPSRWLIVASFDAALAAKKATESIPIIDPVAAGLVSSINRPGGNVTGVSFYDVPVTGKRLELLRQLVPKAELIAILQDPTFAAHQTETSLIETAARTLGQKIITFKAGSEQEIDAAFSVIAKSSAGALLIGSGQLFNGRRSQLVGLAAMHAIPASYALTEVVAAGGLMSYGASIPDAYRRAGIYAARILNGEKPGDLPVELPELRNTQKNCRNAHGAQLQKIIGMTWQF
jgi:putative tryptophan/tyrosine transport system substrate-binding protein